MQDTPNTSPQIGSYKDSQIVDPQTLKFRRAVKDAEQAHSICKKLIEYNKGRVKKSADIMKKYNDEQPWDPKKLQAAGQSWRHNRSTGFMSSMVKRVIPPYKQLVDSSKYLTSSRLPGDDDESVQKSDTFQEEITKVIRQWRGWNNFSYQTILENILMGHCAIAWTDPYDWKPKFCRDDEAIFPDGCPQEASEVPLWMLKQNFLIHELADKLADPQASSAVGWNVENLVKAINTAQPENRLKGDQENVRKFEDTVRETTIGKSYSEGVKVVETYNLFVKEATGKVSHYLVSAKDGKELFSQQDRFDSMEHCLALLSVDVGNGKLYGSKGIGRTLYNTHVAADQARNNICDALYLSGLVLFKATQKGKNSAVITVTHPVAIVGDNYEVQEVQFKVNVDAFFQLDRHLVSIAEVQVGAFMPGQILDSSGEKRTASEINYTASIEQQIREGVLARFWGQYLMLIGEMQRRICSEDNIQQALEKYRAMTQPNVMQLPGKVIGFMKKIGRAVMGGKHVVEEPACDYPEAVDAIVRMMTKGLSAEEVFQLANTPACTYTQDTAQQDVQAIGSVVAKYANNPRVNQQKLTTMDIAATLGNNKAEELVIPEEDNTLQVEATRLQIFEMDAMLAGDDIHISPRDVDDVHMDVIEQKAAKILSTLSPEAATPQTLDAVQKVVNHYGEHLQSATAKGGDPQKLAVRQEFIKKASMLIEQAGIALSNMPQAGVNLPSDVMPANTVGGNPDPAAMMDGAPEDAAKLPNQPTPPTAPGGMSLSNGPKDLRYTPPQ